MRLLTSSLLALLITSAGAVARADDAPAAPPPGDAPPPAQGDHPHHKQTDLEKKMESMNRAFRKLRKQISDSAQNASSLELVATIREGAQDSLTLTPEKAATLPESERAKFISDYQDGIKKLIGKLDALSDALKANKNDVAEADLKDIASFQRDEHKEFRKEHPRGPGGPNGDGPQGPPPPPAP